MKRFRQLKGPSVRGGLFPLRGHWFKALSPGEKQESNRPFTKIVYFRLILKIASGSHSAQWWFSLLMIWDFFGPGVQTPWQSFVRPKTLLRCTLKWKKKAWRFPTEHLSRERQSWARKTQNRNVQIRNLAVSGQESLGVGRVPVTNREQARLMESSDRASVRLDSRSIRRTEHLKPGLAYVRECENTIGPSRIKPLIPQEFSGVTEVKFTVIFEIITFLIEKHFKAVTVTVISSKLIQMTFS